LREASFNLGFDSFRVGFTLGYIGIDLCAIVQVIVDDCVDIGQLERGMAHYYLFR
jgi:hypothetical protein